MPCAIRHGGASADSGSSVSAGEERGSGNRRAEAERTCREEEVAGRDPDPAKLGAAGNRSGRRAADREVVALVRVAPEDEGPRGGGGLGDAPRDGLLDGVGVARGERHGEEEAEGLGADGGEVRERGCRRETARGSRIAIEAEPDLLADRVDGEGEEPPVAQLDELGVGLVNGATLPGRAGEEVGPPREPPVLGDVVVQAHTRTLHARRSKVASTTRSTSPSTSRRNGASAETWSAVVRKDFVPGRFRKRPKKETGQRREEPEAPHSGADGHAEEAVVRLDGKVVPERAREPRALQDREGGEKDLLFSPVARQAAREVLVPPDGAEGGAGDRRSGPPPAAAIGVEEGVPFGDDAGRGADREKAGDLPARRVDRADADEVARGRVGHVEPERNDGIAPPERLDEVVARAEGGDAEREPLERLGPARLDERRQERMDRPVAAGGDEGPHAAGEGGGEGVLPAPGAVHRHLHRLEPRIDLPSREGESANVGGATRCRVQEDEGGGTAHTCSRQGRARRAVTTNARTGRTRNSSAGRRSAASAR